MTISKRDSIIQNIKTALGGITTTAGYNFTVGLVQERLKDPDQAGENFPVLFVIDSDESKFDGSVGELRNEMSPIIVGYVKADSDETDIKLEVRKLLADVEKALCADRYRGGLAINTLPSSIKTDHGFNEPYGMFEFIFKIPYLQEYGTP